MSAILLAGCVGAAVAADGVRSSLRRAGGDLTAALVPPAGHRSQTWRVAKDGTGDFTVIQDAIDAAWPGDTIHIGPGHYEEYATADYWAAYACMHVRKNLTIVGSGAGVTIVGLPVWDPHYFQTVIWIAANGEGLQTTVRDLTVANVHVIVHTEAQDFTVSDCEFSSCELGILTLCTGTTVVERCQFLDQHDLAIFAEGPTVFVSDCEFVGDGTPQTKIFSTNGGHGHLIRGCRGTNFWTGIQFAHGASGTVANCQVASFRPAIIVTLGATATLLDNVFTGTEWTAALIGWYVEARRNVFNGGTDACVEIGCPVDFHGNHIINGGGSSLMVLWYRHGLTEPYDLDVAGNYWGTDDAGQIAAWIDDYHDHHPLEDGHYAIARFSPFADHPVETQATTWGTVKALFD